MLFPRRAGLALVIFISHAGWVAAQDGTTLTFEQALARARESAPVVRAARARTEEARGRLKSASLHLDGNPVLEGSAGRRTDHGEEFTDFEVGLTQGLGAAGRRGARIDGAEAGLASEIAASEETVRKHILEVADMFFTAVRARERAGLLRDFQDVAAEIARITERRFEAGDVPALDVNVAGASRGKARAGLLFEEAGLSAALGGLKSLLGMKSEDALTVSGDLDRQSAYDLSGLIEKALGRPDLRSLAAQMEQAEADQRVGNSFRHPDFGVGLRYQEEEDARILMAGLAVSLPVFDRGQGAAAEASARALRLRLEHDALRQAIETEVRTAFEVYQKRLEAAAAVHGVIPGLSESGMLAARSYEAGRLSLFELLLVRRDVLETRMAHVDLQFEATVAGIRLEASAGVLQ